MGLRKEELYEGDFDDEVLSAEMADHDPGLERRASFGVLDLAFNLLVAVVLISVCVVRSGHRMMWTDELLGYAVLTAPSFGRMLMGWYQGADGGGVFYYLAARPWMWLFHPSVLSLRLFSTFGFIVSMGLMWRAARRFYGFAPVAIAVLLVYLTPPVMMWQEVNGRFYGFFLFAAVLAIFSFLRTAQKVELTVADLVFCGLAHAVLLGSHVLGMVYSGSLILAMVVLDRVRRRVRWRLYASAVAGWVMVPISWHAITSTTSVADTVFWTEKPHAFDLVRGAVLFDRWIYVVLLAAAGLNVMVYLLGRDEALLGEGDWRDSHRLAVYAVVGAMFLGEAFLFAKSFFGISIYADRYLQPVAAALVLLIADALGPLFKRSFFAEGAWWRTLAPVAVVLMIFSVRAFRVAPRDDIYPALGYPERLLSHLPEDGKTVVVTFFPAFELLRTHDTTHRYLFLQDWPYDLSQSAPKEDHSLQRLMDNWKRAGLAEDSIFSCGDILSAHSEFTLFTDPGRDGWLRDRLAADPSVSVRSAGSFEEWHPEKVWKVRRTGAGQVCR